MLTLNFKIKHANRHKFYILGIVLCLFSLNSAVAENIEIEASGFLEWNQEGKSYKAVGNAVASQGARSIKADEIIAFYESEEDQDIVRIEAAGNVNFADNDNSGYSEKLIYEMNTQNISLAGNNSSFKSIKFTAEASNIIQFNEANGELFLQKDAVISIGGNRSIEAQQIEILLTDTGEVRTIKAFNAVKLVEESGRIALSNEAFYEAETGDMKLVDSVQIIDGKNHLKGDNAIINVKTGYSKIFGGETSNRVSGKLILGTSN